MTLFERVIVFALIGFTISLAVGIVIGKVIAEGRREPGRRPR